MKSLKIPKGQSEAIKGALLCVFEGGWCSCLLTVGLIRRLSHVEQKLLTLPEYLSSSTVLVGFALLDLQFLCNCL